MKMVVNGAKGKYFTTRVSFAAWSWMTWTAEHVGTGSKLPLSLV